MRAAADISGTNRVIVIDPGHGGSNTARTAFWTGGLKKNSRSTGRNGSSRCSKPNGWTVFLTRTNDVDVTQFRPRRVRRSASRGFVHQPAFQFRRDRIENNRRPGNLLPHADGNAFDAHARLSPIRWSENLPNNAFDAQNLQLAVRLHSALLRASGDGRPRRAPRAVHGTVLRGQNRPAILIEGGFLSNPQEAKLIESPDYRQKLAEAVAGALK